MPWPSSRCATSLVLDEIFAVGDAGFKARCEERYRQLRALGHTILIVSHDPRTISTFCDRALLLERGHVLMMGDARDVADQYVSLMTSDDRSGVAGTTQAQ